MVQGFRLSPQQRRLWALHPQGPGPVYSVRCGVLIEGRAEVEKLAAALRRAAERNEILSTNFQRLSTMAIPLQVIQEGLQPELQVLDGLGKTDEPSAALDDLMQALAAEEFELAEGSPLKAVLADLGAGRCLLAFSMPSLCADRAGAVNLVREIGRCYESLENGSQPDDEPIQYADLAEWQNQLLEAEKAKAARDFWRGMELAGCLSLRLPFERANPSASDFDAGAFQIPLGTGFRDEIEALGRRFEAPLELILLASWQALLWRLTGGRNRMVACAFEGRKYQELTEALGLFSRYLPVQCQPHNDASLADLVQQVNESSQAVQRWQEGFSWEHLAGAAGSEAEDDRFFPFCFDYSELPSGETFGGASFCIQRLIHVTDRFKLRLCCQARNGDLAAELHYDRRLFLDADIERLADQLEALLRSLSRHPETPLAEISPLSPAEHQSLVVEFNSTAKDWGQEQTLQGLFGEQAAKTPDRIAVAFEDQRLSFGELDARSRQVSHLLRQRGVGPEAPVAICLQRSAEVLAAMLGALRAGGAYLPLEPTQPPRRLALMLEEAQVSVAIVPKGLMEDAEAGWPKLARLDLEAAWADSSPSLPADPVPTAPQSLAYILFTSGSTGRPKAVAVEQRQAVNYLQAICRRLDLPADASYAVVSTFAADLGNTMIFPSLCRGGCLHVVSGERILDPEAMAGYMSRRGVDCLKIVPSHLEALLKAARPARVLPRRRLVLGGEALSAELARKVTNLAADCRIDNHYGPTETTVGVLTWQLDSDWLEEDGRGTAPLGNPIDNTQAYVLDRAGRPLPAWIAGELHIGGAALARGYLGRPGLSAQRFVPDPWGGDEGGRLYRTGDLARHRPGVGLEFLGRLDAQVKIRGYRIELGEIEAALKEHPQVNEAAVLIRQDQSGQKRIVAYLTQSDTGNEEKPAIELNGLRQFLSDRLPDYMAPAAFVPLESMPLTPNGKLDRAALPDEIPIEEEEYVPPSTPSQEILAGIWAEVLGREQVGLRDNFFALGGHSLLATQVVSRVRQAFDIELPLRAIFEAPRLSDLCRRIEQIRRSGAGAVAVPPIERVSRRGDLPLSYAQQRVWFLNQLEPEGSHYNLPIALRLEGPLNRRALQSTLNEIVRRHESLRSRFPEVEGKPRQVIQRSRPIPLPLVDLLACPAERRQEEVSRLASRHAHRIFDLANGPLIYVTLVQIGPEEHALLTTIHHMSVDLWSLGILTREMMALYGAFSAGRPSPLAELPIQYADFAHWQRQWVNQTVLQAQLEYWKEHLRGAPGQLELPTDRPRPALPSYRGGRVNASWPEELLQAMESLSRSADSTLYMTLLAALQALLQRYSGQSDVLVGSPIANRNRAETEDLIGFFLNTLVMRADLSGDPTFRELLSRVRSAALGAFENQDIPFEQVVEALQPERSLNHAPFFQVMFIVQNAPLERISLPGLRMSNIPSETRWTKFDLTLWVTGRWHRFLPTIEYSADLFDRSTVQRMLGHLRVLLEGIAADPDRRLADYPLLSEAERLQMAEWNQTATDYPGPACLHQLFEAQAERTPDRLALAFEDEQLSYGEMNRSADRLAAQLQSMGVGRDMPAAICLQRSLQMVIGIYAILKAGGAYLPLDPGYPRQRLELMLEDSGAPALITSRDLLERLPSFDGRLILSEGSRANGTGTNPGSSTEDEWADSLAYVIFTSGSTGRPKGSMISHRAIRNRLLWMQSQYRLDGSDRVLQKTPFSFDVSVWEFFWPLQVGATLVVLAPEAHKDPALLADVIRRQQITTLHFVPSMLEAFLQEVQEQRRSSGCTTMRRVVSSGEALADGLQRRFHDCLPHVALHNLYGPTEAAVDVTFWHCRPGVPERNVPIGRPIANIQIRLLDRHLKPVPAGVPGELHIGGIGLARGYVRCPGLSAERFIPDPFSRQAGGRLYKSGDLARYRSDGAIDFLGRLDFQVKIRGLRVELGEIEAAIRRHPEIEQAAVVLSEDQRLIGYVVRGEAGGRGLGVGGGRPETGDRKPADRESEAGIQLPGSASGAPQPPAASPQPALAAFLAQTLPEYMVPSFFVFLDELPLNPNGKLDRKALPKVTDAGPQGEFAEPETPTEQLLAGIWSDILGVERIGRNDNFFDRGGHSLLATQVMSRLRRIFGVELALRTHFEAPRLAQLARRIDEARLQGRACTVPPLRRVPRQGDLPLSFAQQRMWFLHQLEPQNPFYNIASALRLKGPLNLAALQAAFDEIVSRHEALRTRFPALDGKPLQVIEPPRPLAIPLLDLQGCGDDQRQRELERLSRQEASRPFDLAAGPLLRVCMLRLQPDEHAMLVTMHHIVSDAWSKGILVRELTALYQAFCQGRPSPLPKLAVQYADFSQWQRQWLSGPVLEEQLAYWKERLDGVEALELPTDRPRPRVSRFRGNDLPFLWPVEISRSLQELSRSSNATLHMTLLALFLTLLHRSSGQDDICVGSPIANRSQPETEGLIGFFLNTLPLRCSLSGSPSFRELLERVVQVSLEAYSHQDVPFEQIVEALQPERSLSRAPIFQVLFTLQHASWEKHSLTGLEIAPLASQINSSKFDLSLLMIQSEQGLLGRAEYSEEIFEASTARRMLGQFVRLARAVAETPDVPVGELLLTSTDERQQLLAEWNDTAVETSSERCLSSIFEDRALQHPDRIAAQCHSSQLSYGELNARSNQLASCLRSMGIEAESRAGMLLERSVQLPVGLLGALKAGAALVPLDPSYPTQRLEFMLRDSGSSVLITQSSLANRLPEGTARPVCLDEGLKSLEGYSAESLWPPPSSANLFYVIYTSGSTGIPKGVALEHLPMLNLILWQLRQSTPSSGLRTMQFSALSFDASFQEMFSAWSAGASLLMVPEEVRRDAPALLRLMARCQAEALFLPFVALQQLAVAAAEADLGQLPRLRHILTAGEQLQITAQLAQWLEAMPGCRLQNYYGPSETHVVTWYTRPGPLSQWPTLPPIGRPISNTSIYILDPLGKPLPVGIPGELLIGGIALARGYHQRPRQTAQKFVPDPFGKQPGGRLYRSGDRARWLADGDVEFLGRFDHQVKVRGYRIELGEVEAALAQHPLVSKAATALREDRPRNKQLVAYLVAKDGEAKGRLQAATLRRFLKSRLPEYMVPAFYVFLDALPISPAGKVDRKALPAPQREGSAQAAEAEPQTATQEILAGIWSDVLGVERVGIEDNFFELGGHSLLMTQVVSRIRKHFQVELPLRDLFEEPTLAGLAQRIEAARLLGQGEEPLPPIAALPRRAGLPLSYTQQRMWFYEQLHRGSSFYNIFHCVQLGGEVEAATLQRTLSEIVQRHEILRTTFAAPEGQPVQIIIPQRRQELPLIDLSALSKEQCRGEAQRLAEAESRRPFDLSRGPLLRTNLIRMASGPSPDTVVQHLLIITMHHIVSDAWSMEILVREAGRLYEAFQAGQPSPLADPAFQYADFAAWQLSHLAGPRLLSRLDYWKRRLEGMPAFLEVPADRPRPPLLSANGARCRLDLPAELCDALHRLSRGQGVTLFILSAAVFQAQLRHYCNQQDVVTGINVAGREQLESEGIIGCFVNQLVLRSDLSGNPTFAEALGRVREAIFEAYRQDVPFDKLVEELRPRRDPSRSLLYQHKVEFLEAPQHSAGFRSLEIEAVGSMDPVSRYDLHLTLHRAGKRLWVSLLYNRDLFEESSASRILSDFQTLCQAVTQDAEIRLDALGQLVARFGQERKEVKEKKYQGALQKFRQARRKAVVSAEPEQ